MNKKVSYELEQRSNSEWRLWRNNEADGKNELVLVYTFHKSAMQDIADDVAIDNYPITTDFMDFNESFLELFNDVIGLEKQINEADGNNEFMVWLNDIVLKYYIDDLKLWISEGND